MMRLHFPLLGACAALLAMNSACVSTQYASTPILTPLFEEKDEFTVNLQASSHGYSTSLDFQGAYALSDHWAVTAAFSRHRGFDDEGFDYSFDPGRWGMDGGELHLGGGYFNAVGSSGVFELYGGFNHLWASNRYIESSQSFFQAGGFFLQPSLGWNISDVFNVSFGTRLLHNNYYSVDYFPGYLDPIESSTLPWEALRSPTQAFFFEPHLTMRLGYQYLKFQAQVRAVAEVTGADIWYSPLSMSFGVVIDFKPRFGRQARAAEQPPR